MIEALQAGDTLKLSGTFDVTGTSTDPAPLDINFTHQGTAANPITITAADPLNPPTLQGFVIFRNPVFVNVDYIRFQGTIGPNPNQLPTPQLFGKESLRVMGGNGWTIRHSEFFGAKVTQAVANVAIQNRCENYAGDPATCSPPTNWKFAFNCVRNAAESAPPGQGVGNDQRFHNIYVNAQGPSTGFISRNIMYAAPLGAHVKLGRGSAGDPEGPAASEVRVRYNTFGVSKRGVILVGEIYGSDVRSNLFQEGTQEGTMIRASTVPIGGKLPNKVTNNYYFKAPPPYVEVQLPGDGGNPAGALPNTYEVFNNVYNGANPLFDGTGCSKFKPAAVAAKAYGRYSGNGTDL